MHQRKNSAIRCVVPDSNEGVSLNSRRLDQRQVVRVVENVSSDLRVIRDVFDRIRDILREQATLRVERNLRTDPILHESLLGGVVIDIQNAERVIGRRCLKNPLVKIQLTGRLHSHEQISQKQEEYSERHAEDGRNDLLQQLLLLAHTHQCLLPKQRSHLLTDRELPLYNGEFFVLRNRTRFKRRRLRLIQRFGRIDAHFSLRGQVQKHFFERSGGHAAA